MIKKTILKSLDIILSILSGNIIWCMAMQQVSYILENIEKNSFYFKNFDY